MDVNLEKLEADREKASEDKADLFDFYHKNWDILLQYLKNVMSKVKEKS